MRRLIAVVSVLLLTAGCGVQSDDGARDLSAGRVPYGLLDDVPAATTTTPPAASVVRADVAVYFVGENGRMVSRFRQVNDPPTVAKALSALLFGVQPAEETENIRSAIDPTAAIQARAIDAATYQVDLSREFAQGSTSEQVLALAQIVFTATQFDGVTAIRFTLDGVPIEVPTGSGSLTSDPVGRSSFVEVEALPPDIGGPA